MNWSSRQELALSHLNVDGRGLEIGPAFQPLAPKAMGFDVTILDHAPQAALQDKYRSVGLDEARLALIEEVDCVWTGGPYREVRGLTPPYNYVLASHVIEHVPDPIGFLLDLAALTGDHGRISLVIPDKRACFDHHRPPTTPGALIDAHISPRSRHSPGTVFDHYVHHTTGDGGIVWDVSRMPEGLSRTYALDFAVREARTAAASKEYMDVHAWVFTPESFFFAFVALADWLKGLGVVGWNPTVGCEFFVTLGRDQTTQLELEHFWADLFPGPAVAFESSGAVPQSSPRTTGYWEVASDGGVFTFGNAGFYGSMGGQPLNQPAVAMAATPDGGGYWVVASDGGVFTFGDAQYFGSTALSSEQDIVTMAATPDGKGYWLVSNDGPADLTRVAIHPFGAAQFYGTPQGALKNPIVGMASTPEGNGYWLVASDGGVFAFGDAGFYGSMGGQPLNQPIVAMAATPDGGGYWLVAADGGVFSFGDAGFYGSMGGQPLNQPIVATAATPDGGGYWLVAADGGVFSFGDASFSGSMSGQPLNAPVVGIAASPVTVSPTAPSSGG